MWNLESAVNKKAYQNDRPVIKMIIVSILKKRMANS